MASFIRIAGENLNYIPNGLYTGVFSHACVKSKANKQGRTQQHLYLVFAVRVPGSSQMRTVKKRYTLPSNRIEADLRNFFGEECTEFMNGMDLDIDALNRQQGRCAELEVTNYQGQGYSVPHSSVKEFYPCGTLEGPGDDEQVEE